VGVVVCYGFFCVDLGGGARPFLVVVGYYLCVVGRVC